MKHAHSFSDYPKQIAGLAGIAGLFGAVTALLLTPKSGKEMRTTLKQKFVAPIDETLPTAKQKAEDSYDKAETELNNAIQTVESQTATMTAPKRIRKKAAPRATPTRRKKPSTPDQT